MGKCSSELIAQIALWPKLTEGVAATSKKLQMREVASHEERRRTLGYVVETRGDARQSRWTFDEVAGEVYAANHK